MSFRTGTVAVVGRTNVGKSTFINAVMGRKVVIVSERPQTTRNRIRCILTTPDAQIVFVDTPGLHQPVNKLSAHLQREALRSLAGLDAVAYMTEPGGQVDPYDALMLSRIQTLPCPKILLVNKADRARGNTIPETLLAYDRLGIFDDIVPISSTKGTNLDRALAVIIGHLPEGAPMYEKEVTTDRPLAFVAAEVVREKVYAETYQELPYATAVAVEEIEERAEPPLTSVYATIIVAKESQKAIVIGSRGAKLREIGTQARMDLESLLGRKVFLSLHVKVKPKWMEDEAEVARLTGD
jgi:GTP-binding protein Era